MKNDEQNNIYYFSDREKGPVPRVKEEISEAVWGGIISIITSRIADSSFGYRYPEICPDGYGPCGCDENTFGLALQAEIPNITWPLKSYQLPSTLDILDLIEFCFRSIGSPIQGNFHSFFGHYHLTFDHEKGQYEFRNDVNRIFARNGIAFDLNKNGFIERLIPEVTKGLIKHAPFKTGDAQLDNLLETSLRKFLDPDLTVR